MSRHIVAKIAALAVITSAFSAVVAENDNNQNGGEKPTAELPAVSFSATGRYLPPSSRKLVAYDTMNISNLQVSVRAIPRENIVWMLSRENSWRYDDSDSYSANSTGGRVVISTNRLVSALNERISNRISLADYAYLQPPENQGKGVYYIAMRDLNIVSYEVRRWGCSYTETHIANCDRLVAVSDIGISVREDRAGNTGRYHIWITSLTGGEPLAGVKVSLHSLNNIQLVEGVSDENGLVVLDDPNLNGLEGSVVIATLPDGSDCNFLPVTEKSTVNEKYSGDRPSGYYLDPNECRAFVWTDRDIYRHGEPILVNALLRNGEGNAPKPFPVSIRLLDPDGRTVQEKTQLTDEYGAVVYDGFTVEAGQRSGCWRIGVGIPGEEGWLGSNNINIEEFVPPQTKVTVMPPKNPSWENDLKFEVRAEHLFGGAAVGNKVKGFVWYSDEPFAPKNWEGFRFGDDVRAVAGSHHNVKVNATDDQGVSWIDAGPLGFSDASENPGILLPKAAVKVNVSASVDEFSSRPVNKSSSTVLHVYPFYIGADIPESINSAAGGTRRCTVAAVYPDGNAVTNLDHSLRLTIERIDRVYGAVKEGGRFVWRTDKVMTEVHSEDITLGPNGTAEFEVPVKGYDDYRVTIYDNDPEGGCDAQTQYGFTYSCATGYGDDGETRAALNSPTSVELSLDKKSYIPGDVPKLTVKSPFKGMAWLTVMRDKVLFEQIVKMDGASATLELPTVEAGWSPNVSVSVDVIQAAKPSRRLPNRAYGVVVLPVTIPSKSFDVKVEATPTLGPDGNGEVAVRVNVDCVRPVNGRAVVTLVDEGINLYAGTGKLNPLGWFYKLCTPNLDLWDVYGRTLPIEEETLVRNDASIGGGGDALLSGDRSAAIPSRRFKPFSRWTLNLPVRDGVAETKFPVKEFVGKLRATAMVYDAEGLGADAAFAPIAPNVVVRLDGPRFAAVGDSFRVPLSVSNRSDKDGQVSVTVSGEGAIVGTVWTNTLTLAKGQDTTLFISLKAGTLPGEGVIRARAEGLDCDIERTIYLPVQAPVPWRGGCSCLTLKPGEEVALPSPSGDFATLARRRITVSESPITELSAALAYLIGYPHGCLEQTVSRAYPLLFAGGILSKLPAATNVKNNEPSTASDTVNAAIAKVCSMYRSVSSGFRMWPDTNYEPWNNEDEVWAAMFLVDARRAGYDVPDYVYNDLAPLMKRILNMAENASGDTRLTMRAVVMAHYVLARLNCPETEKMLVLTSNPMDEGDKAYLAMAYSEAGRPTNAAALMAPESFVPTGSANGSEDVLVDAYSLGAIALMQIDANDERIINWLERVRSCRDAHTGHWGTTSLNATALRAMSEWYCRFTVAPGSKPDVTATVGTANPSPITTNGELRLTGADAVTLKNSGDAPAFVSVESMTLPNITEVTPSARGIQVSRRYLSTDGNTEIDTANLKIGDRLLVEVALSLPGELKEHYYADLVVEDLFPACFDPIHTDPVEVRKSEILNSNSWRGWELRRDLLDDRAIFYSYAFKLEGQTKGWKEHPEQRAVARYLVQVANVGDFVAPGVRVEAMYNPELNAQTESTVIHVTE